MKIIFMGTPEFACPTLKKLINSKNHQVVAVFTQKPKPQGRGMEISESPIHKIANSHNIPVFTPSSLKTQESELLINSLDADLIVVVAYGFIIPKNILESKKYGCINLHPSDLPRFRGAAPLQHTILSGDKTSAICVIQMDEGLDTGPILSSKEFVLPERPSLEWLHNFCSEEGANLVIDVINNFYQIKPIQQKEDGLVYATKLSKADSFIDWNKDAFEIDNMIRAYSFWPYSYSKSNIGDIKIIEAEPVIQVHNIKPGTVIISDDIKIACGKNMLKIYELQLPGKKPISASDFINGYSSKISDIYFV